MTVSLLCPSDSIAFETAANRSYDWVSLKGGVGMRTMRLGLGLALVVGVLGACEAQQLGGGRRNAGAPGPTGTGTIDASSRVYGDACWSASLPAETQPILPASNVIESCAAGTGAQPWSYPPSSGASNDDRRYIVGRWVACNAGLPQLPAHAAIEFGANGRWRLLAIDGSVNPLPSPATLIPLAGTGTSGYYYLLGNGQLDLNAEDPAGPGWVVFVSFTAAMDTLQFTNSGGPPASAAYARTTPSPFNGADNPPPTTAGACSMVGTWDVPPNDGPIPAPAAVFSFDAAGNFVAGPGGTDGCDGGHPMYGAHALSPRMV